tara:strand:+ start:935 stop:1423 length:489 start_codon:yes stop_codon:yes gene_type:complete
MESLSYEECVAFVPKLDVAKCVKVYDGDTFHLGTILPEPYGATRFSCRLLGVDTPELRTRDDAEKALAREARDIVKSLILHKMVNVRVSGMDKYGRLLVRITIPATETTPYCADLSQHLINERVAIHYDGGRKPKVNWTELLNSHTALKSTRRTQPTERLSD